MEAKCSDLGRNSHDVEVLIVHNQHGRKLVAATFRLRHRDVRNNHPKAVVLLLLAQIRMAKVLLFRR